MGQKFMAKVFISYNRKSEAVVKILADDIEALGHDVWYDQELSGGQSWWDHILTTIRNTEIFIFALSPEALQSVACKREFHYATNLGKPILPIQIVDGISNNLLPPTLSQLQIVDYRKQNRETAFRLGRALTNIPHAPPLPDPLPPQPPAPISYLGGLTEQVEAQSNLSYEEQSTLLLDLKRGLRSPETAKDSQTLLLKLRERRDLLVTIADEIDELLTVRDPMPPAPPPPSPPDTEKPKPGTPTPQTLFQSPDGKADGKNWIPIITIIGGIVALLLAFVLANINGSNAGNISDQQKRDELRELAHAVDQYYSAISAGDAERVRRMWKDPTSTKAQKAYDNVNVGHGGICSVLDNDASHVFNSNFAIASLNIKVKCDENNQGRGMREYTISIQFEKNYVGEWRITDLKNSS